MELIAQELANLEALGFYFDSYDLRVLRLDRLLITEEGEKNPVYVDDYQSGVKFPPVAVVSSEQDYEVVDGAKRVVSARAAGLIHHPAIVLRGFRVGRGPVEGLIARVVAGEAPAALVLEALAGRDWEGRVGDKHHITRKEEGTVPLVAIAHLHGASGERPGVHSIKYDDGRWAEFVADIAENGIQHAIFITVDYGEEPKISEGNHRRDAAVELGLATVPVEITYFGHAERQGSVVQRAGFQEAAEPLRGITEEAPGGKREEFNLKNLRRMLRGQGLKQTKRLSKGRELWGQGALSVTLAPDGTWHFEGGEHDVDGTGLAELADLLDRWNMYE